MYSGDLTPIAFSNSDCSGEPAQMCSSPEQSVVLKFIIIETKI